MNIELLSLLGGSMAGFLMKFIGVQQANADNALKRLLDKQAVFDKSADDAAGRSKGVWVRRIIVFMILFAVVVAPFIAGWLEFGTTVEQVARGGLAGWLGFSRPSWETVQGFVILPEVRSSLLAIVGFYFGSSQVK